MRELLDDVRHLFERGLKATLRLPLFLVLSLVQPIVWLVLFCPLMAAVTAVPGFGAASYLQFAAPGIAVMTALFSSVWSGVGLLRDMETGVLDRFLVTPMPRAALVGGRILNSTAQVVFHAGLVLAAAAALGARGRGGLAGVAVALLAAGLLAALLAGTSTALALVARSQEVLAAAVNFIALPLTCLSSMIMSKRLMPGWIQLAAAWNPVDWAVSAARAGFEGTWDRLPATLTPLGAAAVLAGWLAVRSFRTYQKTL